MPAQHSKFLEAYEAAPSRPRDHELAQFSQSASSCYIGLKSVVPDLLVKSARLKAPRRASIDINAPAPDDFLLNRSGRTYEVVPSLVFVRPSSANNVVRNKVAAANKAAADAAEAAVTRRFFQRADLQVLPGMRVDGLYGVLNPPSKALKSRRFTTALSPRHTVMRGSDGPSTTVADVLSPSTKVTSSTESAASFAALSASVRAIREARATLEAIQVPLNTNAIRSEIETGRSASLLAAVGGNAAALRRSLRGIAHAAAPPRVPSAAAARQVVSAPAPAPPFRDAAAYADLADELRAISRSANQSSSRPQSATVWGKAAAAMSSLPPNPGPRSGHVLHANKHFNVPRKMAFDPSGLFVKGGAPAARDQLALRPPQAPPLVSIPAKSPKKSE